MEDGGIKAKGISYESGLPMIASVAIFEESDGYIALEESRISDLVFFGSQPYLSAAHSRVSGCSFTNISHTFRVSLMHNSVERNADCNVSDPTIYSYSWSVTRDYASNPGLALKMNDSRPQNHLYLLRKAHLIYCARFSR